MEITFKHDQLLDAADGETCDLTGSVTVKMPLYHERSLIPKRIGLFEYKPSDEKSNETDAGKLKDALSQMEIMAKAAELLMTYVVRCDLKSADGSTVIKTTDDFFSHPDCTPLIHGLVGKFIGGFMGKKTSPPSAPK